MLVRNALLVMALMGTAPAFAQQTVSSSILPQSEPQLDLGENSFALPVVEYRAPDGTIKISHGIIVGRDISPNARVGLGLFKMKPKYDEDTGLPTGARSKKVALGFSLRF